MHDLLKASYTCILRPRTLVLQDFAEALSRECGSYDMTCLEAGEQEAESLRRRQVFSLVLLVSEL